MSCKKSSSQATHHPCFRQKRRKLNIVLYRLFASGVSQRRAARLVKAHRTTVVRKFRFLAEEARKRQMEFLESLTQAPLTDVFFDEMETFTHTKFKPVSIALSVTKRREILTTEIATMPAKGLLAKKAYEKYGFRPDARPKALKKMFITLKGVTHPKATFHSDQSPYYPAPLRRAFPEAVHLTTKGGRAAVVGQGELKKLAWDPIFKLNHTAAMLRANMNRLFRRTWCTTKTMQGLKDHLAIYTSFHNEVLIAG